MTSSSNGTTRPVVFVVDDDPDIIRLVCHHLEASGFDVRTFMNAFPVVSAALQEPPVLFVLDIMLPGGNGLELCRQIRQTISISRTPVIFLSARSSDGDRVSGLDLGGDDYITKPFSPRELIARIKAVLRPLHPAASDRPLRMEDLEIDASAMTIQVRGLNTPCTVTEFRLLDYLARHGGRVFTRDQLLDAVWTDTRFVTPRIVDVYIRRLREKIERDPENPRLIKTARGVGYRFDLPKSGRNNEEEPLDAQAAVS